MGPPDLACLHSLARRGGEGREGGEGEWKGEREREWGGMKGEGERE